MMEKKIRFKGNEYLLIKGAIATKEQYESGACSFAHLMPNGKILRFGEEIGTEEDIEFVGEEGAEPRKEALVNMLMGVGG